MKTKVAIVKTLADRQPQNLDLYGFHLKIGSSNGDPIRKHGVFIGILRKLFHHLSGWRSIRTNEARQGEIHLVNRKKTPQNHQTKVLLLS